MLNYHRNHPDMVGQNLRKLRQQRGLTLEQVSISIGISAPVLSRKERGEQEIKRADIRAIIEHFRLTPWEAYELWTNAGLVPEYTPPPASLATLPEYAIAFFGRLPFPALMLTRIGYIQVWNQAFELLWQPSRLAISPLHVLDILFSTPPPPGMRESWDRYILHMLHMFQQWMHHTTSVTLLPRFVSIFSQRYGNAFDKRWHSIETSNRRAREAESGEVLIPQSSPYGTITYRAMRGVLMCPQEYESIILIPYGHESSARYQQMSSSSTLATHRLYLHLL